MSGSTFSGSDSAKGCPICLPSQHPDEFTVHYWKVVVQVTAAQICPEIPARAVELAVQEILFGLGMQGAKLESVPSRRQVRRVLQNHCLPSPHSLRIFGRCCSTLKAMACCCATIESAALLTDWSEGANFSRACKRLLGARPRSLLFRSDAELFARLVRGTGALRDLD